MAENGVLVGTAVGVRETVIDAPEPRDGRDRQDDGQDDTGGGTRTRSVPHGQTLCEKRFWGA